MASDFKPLWQQVDPEIVKDWVKNPEWIQMGEFWLDTLGNCRYGWTKHLHHPVVIAEDGTVWSAKWENLMVSLGDQILTST